ncbi:MULTISPECIES: hypothetical protein [Bifidobacterium]|uniref:Uncharacterized protein n=2 Tax=Bifidobacterium TaxID=1678 RepID=A0A261FNJ6_9BIFI|nr:MULTISPECIES: hypothetical protein [Bifidobacterium]OZG60734.1 hypothetical protein BLEM_1703 [Bifidobacterium lemurum]OZG69632.1 hypothetical protein BEUL_0049 [Bifidobacterium eulemuris]QOL32254.1 hypothetical protein BE0216_07145 [Bifidobacterium eulemuris]QOL35214.1 hypothetical protein BL8807_05010 [Bifidobacterium lemurum]
MRTINKHAASAIESEARRLDPAARFGRVRRSVRTRQGWAKALTEISVHLTTGEITVTPVTVEITGDTDHRSEPGLEVRAQGAAGELRVVASPDTIGQAVALAARHLAATARR